jgi:LuxR family maltose regulon positive regulatory protein
MATSVLRTKLYIPPLRPNLVSRPRLTERLNAGLHRKLSLISAPAGFGKTTLLSEWIHCRGAVSGSTPHSRDATASGGRSGAGTAPVPLHPQFAWLSLDEADNDLNRFLAYLVAAVQNIESSIGQGLSVALESPGPVNAEAILTTLLNEITALSDNPSTLPTVAGQGSRRRLVLVLDDYHVIESRQVDEALNFALDHLPPHMHLVIASRIDPSLPLSRLRAGDHMTEVREDDLRFTRDEVATFLGKAMSLDLSAENVAALETRTEGWIAGLQLAALSMQGLERGDDVTDFVNSFTGSDRYIHDYLADEVLQRRPTGTRDFLLQTSILNRLNGPLCDAVRFGYPEMPGSSAGTAVTGQKNSQAILEALEAASLFIVPLDNERRWYRYHHLFADLLRQRLHQNPPPLSPPLSPPPGGMKGGDRGGAVAQLHIRASAWYEANGLEIEALHHAVAADDFERAARLVEGDGNPLYHRGGVTPVLNWLESLPASLLDARPSLWVMYAEVLTARGRPADSGQAYQAAEAALSDASQDAPTRDLLGRIANGRASLAALRRQPEEMIALARRALDLLHPDNLAIRAAASLNLGYAYLLQGDRSAAGRAFAEAIANSQAAGHAIVTMLATERLGNVQAAANRLREAAQTYRRALQLAGKQPLPYIGDAHLGLAHILYEWNDLDAAQHHGQQGLQLTRQIEHTDKSIPCEVFLARLKLAQGDVVDAAAILDEASRSMHQHNFTFCLPEVVAAQVLVSLRQGDLAAAANLAQTHDLPISQARVHLAQGDAAGALALLDSVRRQAEAKGWQDEQLKVMVLQALALHAHGRTHEAVPLLSEALALVESEGFIRTFVDEGVPMAQLLSKAAARGMMPHYTAKLLVAFEDATKDQGPTAETAPSSFVLRHSSLIEPLSQRELQVLQLIAQGLSNREISERLFLALSTVKGHNRNIFGKLQVQRRTEAVARARELGLL